MRRISLSLALGLALAATSARAGVTFEYLYAYGYPNSVSSDGNAIAGNSTLYAPYRWTQSGGVQDLGRSPTPSPGGSPGISADGTHVASTIITSDSTASASGLWTQDSGWQQLMPPNGPPNLGLIDRNYSDVWGLSGDGNTVVGLYWLNTGRAHGFSWTQAGGGVDLGSRARSSRANGVNYDGSVIAGWDENPTTGIRQPAAWIHGSLSVLCDSTGLGEAQTVNASGSIVAGFQLNPATTVRECARWLRSGDSWSATQFLGSVPGTEGDGYGINVAEGISADGKMIVGYCSFDGSPFSTTGFVWTQDAGIMDVITFLNANGVAVDPGFLIQSCQCVTPDGTCIIGFGQDLVSPYTRRTFRIRITPTASVETPKLPSKLALAAPSPNPSRLGARLGFSLPAADQVECSIFDSAGRRIATLAHGWFPAGQHSLAWDGRDLDGRLVAGGVYWAVVSSSKERASQRVVRLN